MDPQQRTNDPATTGSRRRSRLQDASLYLCTTARREQGDLEDFLHAAFDGGVDIVQIRDRSVSTSEEIAALQVLSGVAAEHDGLVAVNDRADVAVLVGADVLHVGQDDLSVAQARRIVGPDVLVGLSTHSAEQAMAAMRDDALDYFCTGPVWETPTKPGRTATGLELVTRTAEMLDAAGSTKPWFTIGGVNEATLPAVVAAGGRRAVVVRGVTTADDPRAAAAGLKGILRGP